jgi:hypothetical protein
MPSDDNVVKIFRSDQVEHRSWVVDPPPDTLDGAAKYAQNALKDFDNHYGKANNACWDAQGAIIKYGNALLKVRALEKSDKKFGQWVKENKLDSDVFELQQERTAAMQIARIATSMDIGNCIDGYFIDVTINGHPIMLSECESARPSHIMAWYNEMRRRHAVLPTAPAVGRNHRPSAIKDRAKDIARAHKTQHGVYPSRGQIMEFGKIASATADQALGEVKAEDAIEPQELRFTKAQDHQVEARIKVAIKALEAEFNERVRKAAQKLYDENFPTLQREQNEAFEEKMFYQKMINNHEPIFTKAEYYDILFCTHNKEVSEERKHRASLALIAKKLQLTGEK